MIAQDDITSITIDNSKDHHVIKFDLSLMQEATEIFLYLELNGKPLTLELNFTFALQHVTELIVLEQRMSSVAIDNYSVVEKISKGDNFALRLDTNRILPLIYRYRRSFASNFVQTVVMRLSPL